MRKEKDYESNLMKMIREITFSDASKADVKRENANVNGNTAMGTMLQYGSTISKEFCKASILSPEFAELHDSGAIHIHDMDFMNMGTLTCCQIDLTKLFKDGFSTGHGHLREPNDIMSYTALAAIAIQSNQNDEHGGQSVPCFDYDMAEGVRKSFRKSYIQHLVRAFSLHKQMEGKDVAPQAEQESFLKTVVESTEKETGEKLQLDLSASYSSREALTLTLYYDVDIAVAEKIQSFTYGEALKEVERKTYQAMEAFIHNCNTMHSRAGAQVPFSSINYGTDTSAEGRMVIKQLLLALEAGLGNGETPIFPIQIFKVKEGVSLNEGDPNYDLFKLACRVSAKRLFPNFSFIDAPFNLQYYKEGQPETEVAYMGCRTRVLGNNNGPEVVTGRGNLSFTTINLVRLGIKHGLLKGEADIDSFFGELDGLMEACIRQLLERMEVQGKKRVKNAPFLMGQGVWTGSENMGPEDTLEEVIKQGTLTVGFIGLAECLKALIGEHHGESEYAQELGLKIITHMRERMDRAADEYGLNFSLIATPAEGLSGRFTRIDAKVYGKIEGVTDRDYYTNSFHVPVYHNISAFDKVAKEAPYHALTNAGHISYIELDGDASENLEAFEAIIRAMHEMGIGYGSINHPVDRDPVCGFSGIIPGDVCPACNRKESLSDVRFDRIRRITGYLVGTVDMFNNAKQAEERDRVKHK